MARLYRIRATLLGHDQDVRGVAVVPSSPPTIASVSRDRSLRLWNPRDDGSFLQTHALYGHEDWITSVAVLPSNRVVTSARDGSILIWDGENPVGALTGHTANVCCLAVTPDGNLVSGSWDKTARVWDVATMTCKYVLTGHQQSVWAVLPLQNGDILTGSADKTIKLWKEGKCVHTYGGHEDAVRALVEVPVGFASASNDASIRVWTLSGECLQVLPAHRNFIYTMAATNEGTLLSAGEDKTLKVWKDGECIATLVHPGSVWTCATLPDGDVVTGCDDGAVRVWTCVSERFAPQDVLDAHEQSLAAAKHVMPAGVNAEEPEVLLAPGQRDGDTKIVKAGDGADAYVWSAAEQQWNKIGSVTDRPDAGGKSMLRGKEYDYVVDVKLDDSGPPLKLGFNHGDNPYSVAQEFIWQNDLNQDFLTEIASFVEQQTKGRTLEAQPAIVPSSTPMDVDARGPSRPTVHVPCGVYLVFAAGKTDAISAKVAEFNAVYRASEELAARAIPEEDWAPTQRMINEATDIKSLIGSKQYASIEKMVSWEPQQLFVVFDLLRLLVLNPSIATGLSKRSNYAGHADVFRLAVARATGDAGSVPIPLRLMALRVIVNGFRHPQSRAAVASICTLFLDELGNSMDFKNVHIAVTYATALVNYAVYFRSTPDAPDREECKAMLLARAMEALDDETSADATMRVAIAVGTLVADDAAATGLATDLGILQRLRAIANPSEALRECINQISALMSL